MFETSLSLGEFLVFVQYLMLLYVPVGRLSRLLAVIQKALASQSRLEPVFLETRERQTSQKMEKALGVISFENVTFEYRAGEPILRHLDLTLRPGEKVAILGATGAGKSSLVNILAYGYPVKEGRVFVQGCSLKSLSPEQIRSVISIVSQDPILFSGTLLENIRYARPEASLSEVREAVRLSHLDEFISRLPNGYETGIGENGVTLSGGERQRLAIARAVLKKSPIWILDEPTSSVDAESEERILRALESVMEGKTVLLITHRTAPLKLVDRILFLEDGKLRENPVLSGLETQTNPSHLLASKELKPTVS